MCCVLVRRIVALCIPLVGRDAATLAKLNNEYAAVSDGSGGLLISDFSNNVIRRRSPSGMATTAFYRGNGYSGDGASPLDARSGNPTYVYVDGNTTWITEVCKYAPLGLCIDRYRISRNIPVQ